MRFMQLVMDQANQYKDNTGHEPRYLILSPDYRRKFNEEVQSLFENLFKYETPDILKEPPRFYGLTIITMGVSYGGSVGPEWSLGH